MFRRQTGARPSLISMLNQLWLPCHMNHIIKHAHGVTVSARKSWEVPIKYNRTKPQQIITKKETCAYNFMCGINDVWCMMYAITRVLLCMCLLILFMKIPEWVHKDFQSTYIISIHTWHIEQCRKINYIETEMLAAPEILLLTNFGATSEENLAKIITFHIQFTRLFYTTTHPSHLQCLCCPDDIKVATIMSQSQWVMRLYDRVIVSGVRKWFIFKFNRMHSVPCLLGHSRLRSNIENNGRYETLSSLSHYSRCRETCSRQCTLTT